MIKIYVLLIITAILIVSCGDNKKEMNEIKDFFIKSSSDLIHLQLEKGIKTKDFNFHNNKFGMQIDSTGKPVFLIDNEIKHSIVMKLNDNKYKIILNKAEIRVYPLE